MINWQLYTDEELRENFLKGGHRLTFGLEPSAQDLLDAVEAEEVDPYHYYDVMGYFPEEEENAFLDDPRLEDEYESI